MKAKLKVTQVRSGSGKPDTMRRTLAGLGLRGPRSEVVVANTPSFRGAIKKVMHLVKVEEVNG
jgi:large subunit ribosomal protein L30